MRKILILVTMLAASGCADDVHEFGKCGDSYVSSPGDPRPDYCERACEEQPTRVGPACGAASCVQDGEHSWCPSEEPGAGSCDTTFEFEGKTGCCRRDGRPNVIFFECD